MPVSDTAAWEYQVQLHDSIRYNCMGILGTAAWKCQVCLHDSAKYSCMAGSGSEVQVHGCVSTAARFCHVQLYGCLRYTCTRHALLIYHKQQSPFNASKIYVWRLYVLFYICV